MESATIPVIWLYKKYYKKYNYQLPPAFHSSTHKPEVFYKIKGAIPDGTKVTLTPKSPTTAKRNIKNKGYRSLTYKKS